MKTSFALNENDSSDKFPVLDKKFEETVNSDNSRFQNLSVAEKLNDSKYRSLIYRTYPNEPTCGCKPITEQFTTQRDIDNHKSNEDFLVCPGGCKNLCCSRAMVSRVAQNRDNGNYDKVLRIMSTYCVGNQPSNKVYNGTYCPDAGMRGVGGSVKEVNCQCEDSALTECLKNVENARSRDAEFKCTPRYPGEYPYEVKTHFLSSMFRNQWEYPESVYQEPNSMPGYACPAQTDMFRPLTSEKRICKKKVCAHVDCLTRKFKEAQEFVNSLGKVPGLPGLGLMDPSESPYFKASRASGNVLDELGMHSMQQLPIINQRCRGPCNPAIKSTSMGIKTTPFTISAPGRDRIIQGSIAPGSYLRDRYKADGNDGDGGPCGKYSCRARRKKIHRERSTTSINGMKMNGMHEKKSKDPKKRGKQKKMRRGRRENLDIKKRQTESRSKRKKIPYVYLSGNTYPGFIYGHKNCKNYVKRVPANMGWYWTQYQAVGRMKPRIGWKPGAISRQIREILKDVKDGLIEKRSLISLASSSGKRMKSKSHTSLKKGQTRKFDDDEEVELPPTLHIQRRGGIYYVTMYPIKEDKDKDIPKLNEPMKPLQFKIHAKKDDNSDGTSSTASDMEIEFSPPAAINRQRRKPDVIHVETQVKQQEILDAFKPEVDIKKPKKEKKVKKIQKAKK